MVVGCGSVVGEGGANDYSPLLDDAIGGASRRPCSGEIAANAQGILAMTDTGNGSTGSPRAGCVGAAGLPRCARNDRCTGLVVVAGCPTSAADRRRAAGGSGTRRCCDGLAPFVAGLQVVVGLQAIGILTRSQVCISPTAGGVALWFLALILHASGARCLEHGALWQARWPRGLLRL